MPKAAYHCPRPIGNSNQNGLELNTPTFFSSSVIQIITSLSVCHTPVVSWTTVKPLSVPDKEWEPCLIFALN
jgi:hypothetical protein